MMSFSAHGTVDIPWEKILYPFYDGVRVFVPDKYIPHFLIDYFDRYPEVHISSFDVPMEETLFGREMPTLRRGSWFHCSHQGKHDCFFSAHKDHPAYLTLHLEDIWDSVRLPSTLLACPLDLTQIYS